MGGDQSVVVGDIVQEIVHFTPEAAQGVAFIISWRLVGHWIRLSTAPFLPSRSGTTLLTWHKILVTLFRSWMGKNIDLMIHIFLEIRGCDGKRGLKYTISVQGLNVTTCGEEIRCCHIRCRHIKATSPKRGDFKWGSRWLSIEGLGVRPSSSLSSCARRLPFQEKWRPRRLEWDGAGRTLSGGRGHHGGNIRAWSFPCGWGITTGFQWTQTPWNKQVCSIDFSSVRF